MPQRNSLHTTGNSKIIPKKLQEKLQKNAKFIFNINNDLKCYDYIKNLVCAKTLWGKKIIELKLKTDFENATGD